VQNQLRAPYLGMWCECYHWEERTRTWTDSNGNRRSETTTHKVVTYTGSESFVYASWADNSGALGGIENFGLVRLKMSYSISYNDTATESRYNDQYSSFCSRNRSRDLCFNAGHTSNVPGFVERVLSLNESVRRPKYLGVWWYALSCFLTLSWFYGIWLHSLSHHGEFFIRKSVSVYDHLRTTVLTTVPTSKAQLVILKDEKLANLPVVQPPIQEGPVSYGDGNYGSQSPMPPAGPISYADGSNVGYGTEQPPIPQAGPITYADGGYQEYRAPQQAPYYDSGPRPPAPVGQPALGYAPYQANPYQQTTSIPSIEAGANHGAAAYQYQGAPYADNTVPQAPGYQSYPANPYPQSSFPTEAAAIPVSGAYQYQGVPYAASPQVQTMPAYQGIAGPQYV